MADYWKSQPRKHCDYCKCWIADNKPSRDFHERGKNHQENVKKKISELMKKGVANAQKKEDEIDSLREMEEGALRALKKDLQKDPKMAAQYGVKIKSKDKEASEDSTQKEVATAEAPPAGEETDWQEAWTDEGFVYYWNAKGERTWDKPPGYVASWERALAAERSDKDPDLDLEVEPASSGSASHSESEADAEAQAQAEGEGTPEGPIQTAAEVDQRAKRSPDPPRGGTPADSGESTAPSRTPPVLDMEPPSLADIPLPPSGPPAPGAAGPSIAPSTAPTDTPAEGPARKVPRPDPPSGGGGRGRDGEVKAQRPPQHWAYGAWQNVPTHAPPPADLQLPPEAPGAFVEEGAEDGAEEGEIPATDATPLPTPVPEPVDEPKIRFRQKKVDTLGKDLVAFKKRKMNARLQGGLRKKDADS